MTQYLRNVLRAADVRDPHTWAYDDIKVLAPWPDGVLEALLSLGLVREIEPSSLVWLWECVEPDWAEPVWLPDAVNGGRVMGFCRCGHEWCGVHVVETDRRRQWAPAVERIVALVGKLLGCPADPIVDVPGRVWSLGSVSQRDARRDVFVVRGASWRDGRTVLPLAPRLASSVHAAVLCMGAPPPPIDRAAAWRSVLSLEEIASIKKGRLVLSLPRLFEDRIQPASSSATRPALAELDRDVLQALAEKPDHALTLAELIAASGYGKKALRASLARLARLGYTQRPAGTTRKGVTISDAGMACVADAGKQ